ncbi:hypothetical protein ACP3WZ_26860, partial [Salmonella enterica]|uniref:hypothetical protein n=1 Tax=Salmonella enterica TaxID=28901 RepID=UPI003CEE9705
MDAHDPIDFLAAIASIFVEGVATGVPVAFCERDFFGCDEARDWHETIGEFGVLSEPSCLLAC